MVGGSGCYRRTLWRFGRILLGNSMHTQSTKGDFREFQCCGRELSWRLSASVLGETDPLPAQGESEIWNLVPVISGEFNGALSHSARGRLAATHRVSLEIYTLISVAGRAWLPPQLQRHSTSPPPSASPPLCHVTHLAMSCPVAQIAVAKRSLSLKRRVIFTNLRFW